jgi:hypothetical protein
MVNWPILTDPLLRLKVYGKEEEEVIVPGLIPSAFGFGYGSLEMNIASFLFT